MTGPTFPSPDSLAAVVAELRKFGMFDTADRIERLDAEMRKEVEIRLFDGQWVNIVNAPGQTIEGAVKATEAKMRENITRGWPPLRPEYKELRAENEQLRAKLAACESEIEVLRQYGNKMCTAMADEYMASDEYLASCADVAEGGEK